MTQQFLLHDIIVVTRPGERGKILCRLIEDAGGKAIYFPTIAFIPPKDEVALIQAIKQLDQQEWLIFVSPQAVTSALPLIKQYWSPMLKHWQIATVGEATKQALEQAGVVVHACPQFEWSSEALLDLPCFQRVLEKKIAIIRGEGGRLLLDNELIKRQAKVLPVISYQRACNNIIWNEKSASLPKVNAILCYSGEGIANLKKILTHTQWQIAKTIPLAVMGARIKQFAEQLGFQTIWSMPNTDMESQLVVLGRNIRNFLYER